MATSYLEDLPVEILYEIGRYLESEREDLTALALVSRRLNNIANDFIHHTVTFAFQDIVKSPKNVLMAERVAPHIRKIVLITHSHLHQPREQHRFNRDKPRYWCWYQDNNPVRGAYVHQIMTPIANLIAKLSALNDLVYSCESYFPPCLLEVLRTKPSCRLHLTSFNFTALEERRQSMIPFAQLVGGEESETQLDQHMLEVLRLPNLTTLCITSGGSPTLEFTVKATKYLVANLGPNLENVYVVNESSPYNRLRPKLQKSWDEYVASGKKNTTLGNSTEIGSLKTLHLAYKIDTEDDLESWFETTDQAKLRALKLQLHHKPPLRYLLSHCHFVSLKMLSLRIGMSGGNFPPAVDREYNDLLAQFLFSLRDTPLTDLKLKGAISRTVFNVIQENLGSKLKRLHVVQRQLRAPDEIDFNDGEVDRIGRRCVALEELLFRPSSGKLHKPQKNCLYKRIEDGSLHVIGIVWLEAITLAG